MRSPMTPWDMWLGGISLYSESFLLISGLLSFLWGLKKKKNAEPHVHLSPPEGARASGCGCHFKPSLWDGETGQEMMAPETPRG